MARKGCTFAPAFGTWYFIKYNARVKPRHPIVKGWGKQKTI